MAGHVCQSISVQSGKEPQLGPAYGRTGSPGRAPRGWAAGPEVGRRRCPEAYVFKNWVSEIVRRVAWRNGVNLKTPLKAK